MYVTTELNPNKQVGKINSGCPDLPARWLIQRVDSTLPIADNAQHFSGNHQFLLRMDHEDPRFRVSRGEVRVSRWIRVASLVELQSDEFQPLTDSLSQRRAVLTYAVCERLLPPPRSLSGLLDCGAEPNPLTVQ